MNLTTYYFGAKNIHYMILLRQQRNLCGLTNLHFNAFAWELVRRDYTEYNSVIDVHFAHFDNPCVCPEKVKPWL